MTLLDVPETCALAINNKPVVGRPIWRLTEGKHTVKLEITWQLPLQPTQRSNQQKKKHLLIQAAGVNGGDKTVFKMAESKMAALRPESIMADTQISPQQYSLSLIGLHHRALACQ